MGLKLLKDGKRMRKAWYCQYMDNGKWHVKKLTTPMREQKGFLTPHMGYGGCRCHDE